MNRIGIIKLEKGLDPWLILARAWYGKSLAWKTWMKNYEIDGELVEAFAIGEDAQERLGLKHKIARGPRLGQEL
jgi:hypothetical protein